MATVMITGVSRGIGLEFLRQYAEAGWHVIGTCRSFATAPEAVELSESHDSVSLYELEVTDDVAVNALAETLRGTAIDVLILNAGVMGKKSMQLGALDAEDFRQVLNVNVVAQAICLQAFSGHVAASDRKVIVGMGSFLGSMGCNTDGGGYSYRAAKAGMHAITVSANHDLKDQGVTAIVMHPGWVQTQMGGPDALITTQEAVTGMRKVIDNLAPEDGGRFFTYSGETLPW